MTSQRITRNSTGPIREIHDPSGNVRSTGSRRLPVTRMSRSAPVTAIALIVEVPADPRSATPASAAPWPYTPIYPDGKVLLNPVRILPARQRQPVRTRLLAPLLQFLRGTECRPVGLRRRRFPPGCSPRTGSCGPGENRDLTHGQILSHIDLYPPFQAACDEKSLWGGYGQRTRRKMRRGQRRRRIFAGCERRAHGPGMSRWPVWYQH